MTRLNTYTTVIFFALVWDELFSLTFSNIHLLSHHMHRQVFLHLVESLFLWSVVPIFSMNFFVAVENLLYQLHLCLS